MKEEMTDGMEHRDGFGLDVNRGQVWAAVVAVVVFRRVNTATHVAMFGGHVTGNVAGTIYLALVSYIVASCFVHRKYPYLHTT